MEPVVVAKVPGFRGLEIATVPRMVKIRAHLIFCVISINLAFLGHADQALASVLASKPADTPVASATPSPSPSPTPSATPNAAPTTNSDLYKAFETDNELRMLTQLGFDNKLAEHLGADANYPKVTALMNQLFGPVKIIDTIHLGDDDTRSIQIVDTGINKETQLVLVDSANPSQHDVIYSNFQQGIGIAATIVSVVPSPKATGLAIILALNGSIDQVEIVVYDFTKKQLTNCSFYVGESDQFVWLDDGHLLAGDIVADQANPYVTIDAQTGASSASNLNVGYILGDTANGFLSIQQADGKTLQIYDKQTQQMVPITGGDEYSALAAVYDHAFFVYDVGATGMGQLRKIVPQASGAAPQTTMLLPEGPVFLERVGHIQNAIFAHYRNGAARSMLVLDTTGATLGKIPNPDCCTIRNGKWIVRGHTLDLAIQSEVVDTKHFTFDLKAGTWNIDPATVMLNTQNIPVTTTVVSVTSADGTVLPMRITRRTDAVAKGVSPVLINSYGGFNEPGYIDPSYSPIQAEFIRRGGLLVSPALRGGNELGPQWHGAAKTTGKIKTFQDLDASAKWLVTNGWSTPKLIASTGASNGGLTVAATGLLFPKDFGIIIPVAGVDDLLAKDRLDTVVGGWSYEYGDDATYSAFFKTISPVELAANQGDLQFLIVDGSDDTRVNPVHSLKLAQALDDFGNKNAVQLLSVRDGGHWLQSVSYQNAIGVQTNIVMWTALFDQYGW